MKSSAALLFSLAKLSSRSSLTIGCGGCDEEKACLRHAAVHSLAAALGCLGCLFPSSLDPIPILSMVTATCTCLCAYST